MMDDRDLDAAVAAGLIDSGLRDRLVAFFAARRQSEVEALPAPRFEPIHVLYYAGALIVIGAMGLFATAAFDRFGGWALSATALAYALALTAIGDRLWRDGRTRIPGGLLVAAAASMAPLAIYGVQDALDVWSSAKPGGYNEFYPLVNASWVWMEVGAIVASAVTLARYRFPFIVLIGAFATWFLSMDLAALLRSSRSRGLGNGMGVAPHGVGASSAASWAAAPGSSTSSASGRDDFAFWLHLFGATDAVGRDHRRRRRRIRRRRLLRRQCPLSSPFACSSIAASTRCSAPFGVALYLGHLAQERLQRRDRLQLRG